MITPDEARALAKVQQDKDCAEAIQKDVERLMPEIEAAAREGKLSVDFNNEAPAYPLVRYLRMRGWDAEVGEQDYGHVVQVPDYITVSWNS